MKINLSTIRAAQSGESESMADLSMIANKRAFTYIYRLTIDYHLSQDLAQETVLDLIKSLPQLEFEHINFFWSWLYRTALGKVQHHFRAQGNNKIQQNTTVNSKKIEQCLASFESGVNTLIREELRKSVLDAMQNLRLRYRNILTLRCLDNLSYAEIAAISGGSELQARLLFFRAKKSLQHQLARKGLKKDQLLSALGLFGILTATVTKNAAAATSVTATSLAVAPTATLFGVSAYQVAVTAFWSITALSMVTVAVVRWKNTSRIPMNVPPARQYINPIPHPFAELLYLLESNEFSPPIAVTSYDNPTYEGFQVIDTTAQEPAPVISTPEKVLIENQSGNMCMVMPRDSWVEVIFEGPIIDTPGPDLYYTGWNCRSMRVVLIGEQGQNFMLPILNCLPDCPLRCFCNQIAPFDMADFNLNFTPVKVRLQGIYGMGQFDSFQLSTVRAKIAK